MSPALPVVAGVAQAGRVVDFWRQDMKCYICGSEKITHYRQIRIDGVKVVTARCENGHIPEKGKPFYSVRDFEVDKLPSLTEFTNKSQYHNWPLPLA